VFKPVFPIQVEGDDGKNKHNPPSNEDTVHGIHDQPPFSKRIAEIRNAEAIKIPIKNLTTLI